MYLEKINSPSDLKKLNIIELKQYAAEVRLFITEVVKNNGGHLASNLGAVELTIALHYVFDSPNDKILFDVGHQSYAHKIITGRRDDFNGLRKDDGLSGFPSPEESDADLFLTGHSSTSLSLALGLARARDLSGDNYRVLPVIGDGSFTGGMVYEALNDIGENKTDITIILNDNKMSISRNVSAISRYLTKLRLSRKYNIFKANVKMGIAALPFSSKDNKAIKQAKIRIKELFLANRLFENFGISYYGPINGHDIGRLVDVFKRVAQKCSQKKQPSIIHLVTQKGRGYQEAEENPDKFHGIAAPVPLKNFDNQDGQVVEKENTEMSFSALAGETLTKLAKVDKKIVAITAAMGLGTGLEIFAQRFPDRYFDVSIAEQHAVSLSAGLAKGGFKPFFFVYSTFLQRGFDQILHEVSLNNLPVKFLIDRAGAIGSDGVTHQGIFDLSYLSLIPGLTILTPRDGDELASMLKWAADFEEPLAIRYPKSFSSLNYPSQKVSINDSLISASPLKWELLISAPSPIYILASGSRMLELALQISDVNIVNARSVKPLDFNFLDSASLNGGLLITLEDNVLQGGFGQSVLSYFNCNCDGRKEKSVSVAILAHNNEHLFCRDVNESLIQSGITKDRILKIIKSFKYNLGFK